MATTRKMISSTGSRIGAPRAQGRQCDIDCCIGLPSADPRRHRPSIGRLEVRSLPRPKDLLLFLVRTPLPASTILSERAGTWHGTNVLHPGGYLIWCERKSDLEGRRCPMAVDQTASVLLELYRAARESPIPEFQERALQLLKPLCRFDSAMWGVGEVRPDTGLALHSIHLHNLPQEMFTSYEEIKNHDLPAFEAARRMGEVCTFNLRDMMPGSRYSDVASFDARYGLQNLLVTTTHDSVLGSVGFIALWREKDRDRYTEDERRCGET